MNKTLTCPLPGTINALSPNGFLFSIEKLPGVSFFAQQVNLPDLSIGAPEVGTSLSTMLMTGETLTYGSLNVQFLVDEKMDNFVAVHNWLVGLGFPQSHGQYEKFLADDGRPAQAELPKHYSDAVLAILGTNNKPVRSIRFIDAFPTNLDSIMFSSVNDDVQYIGGNATFRYSYYKFE